MPIWAKLFDLCVLLPLNIAGCTLLVTAFAAPLRWTPLRRWAPVIVGPVMLVLAFGSEIGIGPGQTSIFRVMFCYAAATWLAAAFFARRDARLAQRSAPPTA